MTVIFCLTLVVVCWGLIPTTSGSCSCHEHTTNLATGVLGSRSSTVERSTTRTAAAGTFLRFFQTIFENTSLWWLKRLVTLSTYRRYINECIYLSIYCCCCCCCCCWEMEWHGGWVLDLGSRGSEFKSGQPQNYVMHYFKYLQLVLCMRLFVVSVCVV